MVEYALVLAALVVLSFGAIQGLEDNSEAEVANEFDCISERPPPPSCQKRAVTTTTTTGGASTSTTLPVETTETTVPTTATPTTETPTTETPTTETPTTETPTTAPAPAARVTWHDEDSDDDGRFHWEAWAQVRIRNGSTDISNAVVTIEVRLEDGSPHATFTCTTGSNGRCPSRQWIDDIPNSSDWVTFVVVDIDAVPPLSVPSSGASERVNDP